MNTDSPQINADERGFLHSELTNGIIRVFYDVYNDLGHGFLESVYENSMYLALKAGGFRVERQVAVPVWFRGEQVGDFKADLIVDCKVIVELKAARALERAHESQLLNYLRATPLEIGLLLNFGSRPEIRRLAFANERKKISVNQR